MSEAQRLGLEARIRDLEAQLASTRAELDTLNRRTSAITGHSDVPPVVEPSNGAKLPLLPSEYRRYGRQMILDGFGLPAQLKLKHARILVVGVGGLGCPAIQYLAAAGVGTIGMVDHDIVELSNLQRQILHTDATIGMYKTESAKIAAERIQPGIEVICYNTSLTKLNARDILSTYDIVLDCTDNLPTRYLLSDYAALLSKPLVSGAAIKFDGQLCIYNLGDSGPCYRCIFPKAPSTGGQDSCEESGVLGVVTGVIGTLQAMEAIKIIVGLHEEQPTLLVFSARSVTPFRSMKLRPKRASCPACGGDSSTREAFVASQDYVAFCGGERPDPLVTGSAINPDRVSVEDLRDAIRNHRNVQIIDVRPTAEFTICSIPKSISVPLADLLKKPDVYVTPLAPPVETYVVCRRGNDSQVATAAIRAMVSDDMVVKDVIGGLRAWSRIDPTLPIY